MKSSGMFGGPVAFGFLLLSVFGGVGCEKHERCASIQPGTPLAELPLGSPGDPSACRGVSGPIDEGSTAACCSVFPDDPDAGSVWCHYGPYDCTNIAPAELRWVPQDVYGGFACQKDEGFGERFEQCGVVVRDGGVVGACSYCPPD
jgi:hypothetical protein